MSDLARANPNFETWLFPPPYIRDPTHGRPTFSPRRERVSGFSSRIVCCSCLALTAISRLNFSAPSRFLPSQYASYLHPLPLVFLPYLPSYTYVLGTSALSTIDNRQIRSSTRCLVDRQPDTTTRHLAMHAIANLLALVSNGVRD